MNEIVLPAGTLHVTVGEIPRLLALAIHPEPSEGKGRIITSLFKQGIEQEAIPAPQEQPLNESDWAVLNGIWSHLPKYQEGMNEASWRPYAEAFDNARHRPDWSLIVMWRNEVLNAQILQVDAEAAHKEALRAAISKGALVALSHARLPVTFAHDSAIVMIDALKAYAMGFGVGVRLAEAQTVESSLALLARAPETREQRQDRRLQLCIDAGLPMNDRAALSRLPDGVGAVADHEGIKRQPFSADVKAALKRRDLARREGASWPRV